MPFTETDKCFIFSLFPIFSKFFFYNLDPSARDIRTQSCGIEDKADGHGSVGIP